MELRRYLDFLQRRWWLLILGAAIAGGAAYLISKQLPQIYSSDATIVVFAQAERSDGTLVNDLLADERLTNTYAGLVERRPNLTEVKRRLGISLTEQQLDDKVSVSVVEDTQLIRITAEDSSAARSAEIANAVAHVFIDVTQFGDAVNVSVVNEATTPESPAKPDVLLNTMIAIVLGMIVALGIGVALEYLDDTVKTAQSVERLFGLSTLGIIPRFGPRWDGSRAGALARVDSPYGEHYRELRTYVQFARQEMGLKTILVASAGPHEGRSTVAANLAIVFAQAGDRVILVDADLRRPSLNKFFGTWTSSGLSGALRRDLDPVKALIATGVDGLKLLPSGPPLPNPSELLTSAAMDRVLDALRENAELIVIDSPPMSAVTDAGILASRVDGTLIVVEAGHTRADVLRSMILALGRAKSRVIGVVLNKVKAGGIDYGFYGYRDVTPQVAGEARTGPLSGTMHPGTSPAASGEARLTSPTVETD